MDSYVIYWPADWVKTIIKNGDVGPLVVIYGGEHGSQPPLGKVTLGDTVFPVTLMKGNLFVLGRLTISNILSADEYTEKILKIKREPFMWDSYTAEHKNSITHRIPRTCADNAAIGTDGTLISMNLIPVDKIPLIKLGTKAGSEQPLKLRNEMVSINNFSGYFRRMSEDTTKIFNGIIDNT